MEPAIRVLIVDDHTLIREAARAILTRAGFEVVGEARTGREAVEQAAAQRPEIVLMDLRMPDMDGLEATRVIKAALPDASILILTGSDSTDDLAEALHAGASGYLLKESVSGDLVQAIRLVRSGESVIEGRIMAQLMARLRVAPQRAATTAAGLETLTPMESQVLACIVEGLTNGEIAARMHFSAGSIKNAVQRIIEKLGVSDRTQAAVLAVRSGFCP